MSDPVAEVSATAEPEPVVMWGTSGHAAVVADVLATAPEFALFGLIDDVHTDRHGQKLFGANVLGDSQQLDSLPSKGVRHLFVAIGDNDSRLECARRAASEGYSFPTLVDPRSHVGSRVQIGAGTVLMPNSAVNADAHVGEQVIVNTGAIVEHSCRISDGVHVGPGAVVAGWAQIEERAWIGAGAVIKDRVRVGSGAVIGAGAVVVKDVPARVVAVGIPARPVRDVKP